MAAGILGTLAQIGGQFGAAALADDGIVAPPSNPLFNPSRDPVNAAGSLELLSRFGIFDPSVLQVSSPLNRAIEQMRAAGVTGSSGNLSGNQKVARFATATQEAFEFVEKARREGFRTSKPAGRGKTGQSLISEDALSFERGTEISPEEAAKLSADEIIRLGGFQLKRIEPILGASGFGTLEQLFQAENDFQTQVSTLSGRFSEAADRNAEISRIAQQRQLERLQSGEFDLSKLREVEQARSEQRLEDARRELLRLGNVAGLNPAGGLRELERLRETEENDALGRALALFGGTQQEFAGLQLADPTNVALGLVPGFTSSRNPISTGNPLRPQQISDQRADALSAAVSSSGALLGDAIQNFGKTPEEKRASNSGGTGGNAPGTGGK